MQIPLKYAQSAGEKFRIRNAQFRFEEEGKFSAYKKMT